MLGGAETDSDDDVGSSTSEEEEFIEFQFDPPVPKPGPELGHK